MRQHTPDQRGRVRQHCLYAAVLTLTVVAAYSALGGGAVSYAAEPPPSASGSGTAKALAVPPGWVGRKPPSATAQKIEQLEATGVLPKLDTSPSIAGPDANANGIRDDIDRYIELQNYPLEVKPAVLQEARSYQQVITANLADPNSVEAAKLAGQRATRCLSRTLRQWPLSDDGIADVWKISDKIKALTLNTKARLLAWIEFDKKMDGQVFSSIKGEVCE